jgi:hypothetical protein
MTAPTRSTATPKVGTAGKPSARTVPAPCAPCYIELADRPFPAFPESRHHRLEGRPNEFWEYEVGGSAGSIRLRAGGERVRYRDRKDDPLVVYGGPPPPDTP